MKSLIALTLLFTLGAEAGTLRKIFKNDKAPDAQKYLAVFSSGTHAYGDEYVVAFGEGMKYKIFDTDLTTWSATAYTTTSLDEQMKLTQTGIERDKAVKVSITDMRNTKLADGTYTVYNSPSALQYAKNIDKVVEAEFTKYRTMDSPATPSEVRRIFRQMEIDAQEEPAELPVFDLQIEWSFGMTNANAQKASAYVTMAGQDLISREVLKKGSKWYKDINDATYDLEEMIDNEVDIEEKTFASFGTKISYEGLSPRLTKAIGKHLKVEVLEVDGWECEDSNYTWTSATWILKDGSSVSYHPGTECD